MVKGKAKKLKGSDSLGWLHRTPLPGFEKKLQRYLQRFVFECEAIGCSKQRKGFIDDLTVNNAKRLNNFFIYLLLEESSEIKVRYFDSVEKLSAALVEDKLDGDDFLDSDIQFVYFVFNGITQTNKRVNQLPEFKSKRSNKKTKLKPVKAKYYRLDSFFRHLRNSLAHGQCLAFCNSSGTAMWAFQDSNAKDLITSRFLVSEQTIESWIRTLDGRDKTKRCLSS